MRPSMIFEDKLHFMKNLRLYLVGIYIESFIKINWLKNECVQGIKPKLQGHGVPESNNRNFFVSYGRTFVLNALTLVAKFSCSTSYKYS